MVKFYKLFVNLTSINKKNFCVENYEQDELRLDLFFGMKDGQFYLIESLGKDIKSEKI